MRWTCLMNNNVSFVYMHLVVFQQCSFTLYTGLQALRLSSTPVMTRALIISVTLNTSSIQLVIIDIIHIVINPKVVSTLVS